jgi:hypothetical protein
MRSGRPTPDSIPSHTHFTAPSTMPYGRRIAPPCFAPGQGLALFLAATLACGRHAEDVNADADQPLASSIQWTKHLGVRRGQPHIVYSIMIQGLFLAPTAPDWNERIQSWLHRHPRARATTLTINQPMDTRDSLSQMRGVLIADANDTLNVDLVRSGACPGWAMTLYPGMQLQIPRRSYDRFVRSIIQADSAARTEHLGVWAVAINRH